MRQSTKIRHHPAIWNNDLKHLSSLAVKAAYVLLQEFDLLLSILATSLGLHELNPLMRSLLAMPIQLLVAKLVIPVLIAWFVPSRFLVPAIILLSIIIGWNLKELLLSLP